MEQFNFPSQEDHSKHKAEIEDRINELEEKAEKVGNESNNMDSPETVSEDSKNEEK